MLNTNKHLVIATGGTGGHIFPGIVISQYFKSIGWQVSWIGCSNRMEKIIVPKFGINIKFIEINNFYLKNLYIKKILFALDIFKAIKKTRNILYYWKPNIVLCMGNYISIPTAIAAKTMNIPIIIHEQNAIVGKANKLISIFAKRCTQAFPNTIKNATVVGNPIRSEILNIPKPIIRLKNRTGIIRVLVLGGSQGASILNKVMPIVTKVLKEKIIVWHQVGYGYYNLVKHTYNTLSINNIKITEFITNIALAYSWADIVICRSGALTVSELAVVGLPSILVPYIHKDQQQYFNATLLVKVSAAIIVKQTDFTPDKIINILLSINRQKLFTMACCAQTIATYNSPQYIVKEVNNVIKY
ncbi:MAG: undecaprenyldiphospho-muramoylpentapeptide beta-N-acetylglucosaminyltransferase [Candidatus Lightella neohaematopini]|nr:undecaprenyldiphospho-muramoylpentapeptide beta-N-acetylglucosaminyltransferase [Candidatus Lightella neohaematopini]